MARKPKQKPARRKPGTGAIRYKAGRAHPWEASLPIRGERPRVSYHDTREEAAAHLDKLVAERDHAETPRNIARGSWRVDRFLTFWLNIKIPHISPKTVQDYTYQVALACEIIGAMRVDEVGREDADSLLAHWHRRGYHNVGQLRMVLRQAFEYALEEDWIRRNPFHRAKAPPVERRTNIALSTAQRDDLLAAGAVEDDSAVPLAPLWHLYSRLGFRRGEGLGLRWADVDWKAATLSIAQQYTNLGGETIKRPPKTKRARRVLPCPPDVLAMLDAHRAGQRKRAAGDRDWVEAGLVFAAEHGGALSIGVVRRRWEQLRTRAGMPAQLTIHDLRHTALTILEKSGAPVSIVQSIAGHASSSMTLHYVDHTTLEDMRRALG